MVNFKFKFWYLFFWPLLIAQIIGSLILIWIFDWSLFQGLIIGGSFFILTSLVLLILSYRLEREYQKIVTRTQKMSLKFRHWIHQEENNSDQPESELFLDLYQALNQVKTKLLSSRKKLAHEFEQAQALMRSLQDAVVAVDLNYRCLYFNSPFALAFLENTHIEKLSTGELLLFQAIRHDLLAQKLKELFVKPAYDQFECRIIHKATQLNRDFVVKISPLFEEKEKHEIYGALIIFHDVTELKNNERNRLLFIENASHELRTPLTSIKGYLDLAIADLEKNLPIKVWLNQAQKGVQRLVHLVEDLLQLAVLDKKPKISLDWINPLEITERVCNLLAPQIYEKKANVKVTSDFSLILLDEGKIEQILINLISNSIRYNNSAIEVRVSWKIENKIPILYVEDNGIGISQIHWDKLFDRFYRVDKKYDREQGGTGLGLAIVKQLVEIQGGKISVFLPDNHQGIGFKIEFPEYSLNNNK